MRNIKEVLTQLDPQLLIDIESSFCSIFKIDLTDPMFPELVKKSQVLQDATYIINPNFNSAHGMIFLDQFGKTLLEANFFANLISHLPLDFEYEIKDYTLNHPLEKLLKNMAV